MRSFPADWAGRELVQNLERRFSRKETSFDKENTEKFCR